MTEFNYRYAAGATRGSSSACRSHDGEDEARELLATLARHGYPVLDLSGNEVAKLHVRHMVGGRVPGLADEHLYRFEFPERPGALLAFLKAIGQRWNISLFHYRNHGSDYGRVLAGVQVPAGRARGLRAPSRGARLRVLGRDRQPRVPPVPRRARPSKRRLGPVLRKTAAVAVRGDQSASMCSIFEVCDSR